MADLEIDEMVQSISNTTDLSRFVTLLDQNLTSNPDDWENVTLSSYLQALASLIDGLPSRHANLGGEGPLETSWSLIADILYSASIYE